MSAYVMDFQEIHRTKWEVVGGKGAPVGIAVSSGVVEGRARVVLRLADAAITFGLLIFLTAGTLN